MSKSCKLIIIPIIILLVFSLSGCNNAPDKNETATGGTLNIAITSNPLTLDPALTTDGTAAAVDNQIFESLVTFDSKFAVVPRLASKVDTNDNQTYTFTLRQGVNFHNGKEMTADDVVASLNRWQKLYPAVRPAIKGATFAAKDKYSVVMKLPQPSIYALYGLAMKGGGVGAQIMPKEVVDSATPTGVSEYIGTGPFKIVKWEPNQYIHLAKNPDYKPVDTPSDGSADKKQGSLDEVFFRIVPDTSTQIAGLQTGQYDIVNVPGDSLQQVKSIPNVKTGTQFGSQLGIFFNMKTFANVKMRQAVNYAVDKNAVMLASMGDKELYRLDSGYMSKEQAAWYSDAGKEIYQQYDVTKAKELLAHSGYNGQEITLLALNSGTQHNAAVTIQQQLQQAGFKVKLDAYDSATFYSRRADPKNWDIFITNVSPNAVPQDNLTFSLDWAGGLKKGTDDDAIITALQELQNAKSVQEAQKLWPSVQQLSWQVLPFVILGEYASMWAYSDKIQGYQRTSNNGLILWNTKIVK